MTLQDGALHLEVGPELGGSLSHWSYDTFEIVFDRRWQGEGFVTFSLGADGTPARLDTMGLTWKRVREPEPSG